MKLLCIAIAVSVSAFGQAVTGGLTPKGAVDASGASSTKPSQAGNALPGTCSVGRTFFRTADNTYWYCSATNTWTQFGSAGGTGTVNSGASPQIGQYRSSGTAISAVTLSGDASIADGGAVTVLKVNGSTPGNTCTNQFTRSINSSGVGTCAAVVSADLNITTSTCTNQFVSALSSGAVATCSTVTLAGAQFANQGTTTTVLHGNAAGNPSFGAVVNGDIGAAAVTSAKLSVEPTRRTQCLIFGANNATAALVDADLGPQSRQYFMPYAGTLVEMEVAGDAGTPNIILGRSRAGTIVNATSAALATASSGGIACSNSGGTTGIDGATTCSGTLQNTSWNAGDWIVAVSGTAGGTAKEMTACLTFVTTN